jgi:hypothetical protein
VWEGSASEPSERGGCATLWNQNGSLDRGSVRISLDQFQAQFADLLLRGLQFSVRERGYLER